MDWFFRFATSVYGGDVLLGVNWSVIPWFFALGVIIIVSHAVGAPFTRRRIAGFLPDEIKPVALSGAVVRHRLPERLFHWALVACVLTLLVSAFGPILGWKFDWVPIHWIAGVLLALVVLFHLVRSVVALDFWSMMPDLTDIRDALRSVALVVGLSSRPPGKAGKYPLMQKMFHWGIAGWIVLLIATGLVMLAKIDTPFWHRNPYFLTDFQWGLVYSAHDILALGMIPLVMMHAYFALRPDKIYLLRSMILGGMARDVWLEDHDPLRWKAEDVKPRR